MRPTTILALGAVVLMAVIANHGCESSDSLLEVAADTAPEVAADRACRDNWRLCRRDSQCCSGNCDGRRCRIAKKKKAAKPKPKKAACKKLLMRCTSNSQCCDGRCSGGKCLPKNQKTKKPKKTKKIACKKYMHSCSTHSQCCSKRCQWGVCASANVPGWSRGRASSYLDHHNRKPKKKKPKKKNCKKFWNYCTSNSQCCSGNCDGRFCKEKINKNCKKTWKKCSSHNQCCSKKCYNTRSGKKCFP